MNTHILIEAPFSDSMEDWTFDMVLKDTLQPVFRWAEQYSDDIVIKREIDFEGLYPRVIVKMEVEDPSIVAHYVLEHGKDPIKKLMWGFEPDEYF